MNNVWASDWGMFEIPPAIYKLTTWECDEDTGQILDVAPIPDNWPFFRWLHEIEVENGKPRRTEFRIKLKRPVVTSSLML